MRQRVIYVFTHDSIGLGEDGPTHQPVEQLATLRATPNVLVFRPADPIETAECWQLALENADGPSALALTRQGVPLVRGDTAGENRSARGAYVLAPADGAKVTLLATGSEISVALGARDILARNGIAASVVSMPCWQLFERQDASYKESVIPRGTLKVAIEAAAQLGWDRYIGDGLFIGMRGFGASAPIGDLYKHFGITADAVAQAVTARLKR
jgi:transketolase